MTRLLVPTRTGLATGGEDDNGFLSRLGKFIPAETGTLFTVVNAYLSDELSRLPPPNLPKDNPVMFLGLTYHSWAWVVLIVCFLANIVILDRMYDATFAGNPLKPLLKKKHIFASSVGFIVWAYAMKSPVFETSYHSFLAVLAIGAFMVLVGKIKPPQVVQNEQQPMAQNPPQPVPQNPPPAAVGNQPPKIEDQLPKVEGS